jgi:hypothetical protein
MKPARKQSTGTERDLEAIIEKLAVKIHEAWMEFRRAEGWTYGEHQDDVLKTHPCLVDFDRLPEGEKEVDRRSARTTIQGLVELSYDITHLAQNAAASAQPSVLDDVRRHLMSKAELSLGSLGAMWKYCRVLSKSTAGDGLFLVFSDIETAGQTIS